MMKSLTILCVIAIADAIQVEECCSAAVTTCCPSNQDKSPTIEEHISGLKENIENILEGAMPELKDGEQLNEEALSITKNMFDWMDYDYDLQLDILNEVEQTLDYDISRGDMSLFEADLIRQYFFDADADDGEQDYLVDFQQLYDYNVKLVDTGLWAQMTQEINKNRDEAEQEAAILFEIFDINKDGFLTIDEYNEVSAQKLADGEVSQAEIDWYKDQMKLADEADGVTDN